MNEKDYEVVREALTKLEHNQWIGWSKALARELEHYKKALEEDGDVEKVIGVINHCLNRWEDLWIPYDDLPEIWKNSDCFYAEKVLEVLRMYGVIDYE